MKEIKVKLIGLVVSCFSSEVIIELLIDLLRKLVQKTDNGFDDAFVNYLELLLISKIYTRKDEII